MPYRKENKVRDSEIRVLEHGYQTYIVHRAKGWLVTLTRHGKVLGFQAGLESREQALDWAKAEVARREAVNVCNQ
jgi:hypothetical protein